jgi:hypothetical protein
LTRRTGPVRLVSGRLAYCSFKLASASDRIQVIAFGSEALGGQLALALVCAPPALQRRRFARLQVQDDPVDLSTIQSATNAQHRIQYNHDIAIGADLPGCRRERDFCRRR